jgi:hypothetical protein
MIKLFRTDNETADILGKKFASGDLENNQWLSGEGLASRLAGGYPVESQDDFDKALAAGIRVFSVRFNGLDITAASTKITLINDFAITSNADIISNDTVNAKEVRFFGNFRWTGTCRGYNFYESSGLVNIFGAVDFATFYYCNIQFNQIWQSTGITLRYTRVSGFGIAGASVLSNLAIQNSIITGFATGGIDQPSGNMAHTIIQAGADAIIGGQNISNKIVAVDQNAWQFNQSPAGKLYELNRTFFT